jgi:hypothetical protein
MDRPCRRTNRPYTARYLLILEEQTRLDRGPDNGVISAQANLSKPKELKGVGVERPGPDRRAGFSLPSRAVAGRLKPALQDPQVLLHEHL